MTYFTLLCPNNRAITEQTKITFGGKVVKITTETLLCQLIKKEWCKHLKVRNFTGWAEEMNADENFEGGFTIEDALDNLSGMYQLNVDGKHVHVYDFFMQHLPFKQQSAKEDTAQKVFA